MLQKTAELPRNVISEKGKFDFNKYLRNDMSSKHQNSYKPQAFIVPNGGRANAFIFIIVIIIMLLKWYLNGIVIL